MGTLLILLDAQLSTFKTDCTYASPLSSPGDFCCVLTFLGSQLAVGRLGFEGPCKTASDAVTLQGIEGVCWYPEPELPALQPPVGRQSENAHFFKDSFIYLAAPALSCSTWDLVP